jgi:type VI secretion system protein ImpK
VVGAAAVALLALTFVVYYSRLATVADPLHAQLSRIGVEVFSTPPPPSPKPVKGPTLKQLLQPEEAAGVLTVQEDGGRSVVTLRGSDLFASGSADVNPMYGETLGRIAAALNKVRGSVMVVGHTDSQRIRLLTFRDNYHLSHERAESVANVLKRTMERPATLQSNGVGSSQPLGPETDDDSRARNRRVEIIHLRET